MSEEDVRAGLRGAVADEPPLMFDPDELMETARRQTKRRRALAAVGVATAVVAVAAVAVPLAIGNPRGNDEVTVGGSSTSASPSTTTSASPPAFGLEDIKWPPPGVKPRHYTVAELTQRGEEMRTHLSTRFPSVVPGATRVEVERFGGEATGTVNDGQDYLETTAAYLLDGTAYSISVQVNAPGADVSPEHECFQAVTCETRKLADGTWMVNRDDDVVAHYRDDGVVVRVSAYWYDITNPASKSAPDVPLTVDQVIELATDPELYL